MGKEHQFAPGNRRDTLFSVEKLEKKKRETSSEKLLYITVTFSAVQSDDGRILDLKNCGVVPLLAKQTPYLIAFLNQQD